MTSVPFTDLSRQWIQIRQAVLPELDLLFTASAYCLGPWVERFETDVAEYLGVKHAIGVNSGTSAIHLAIVAAGIGTGDKVLVPSHTFIGTVWGIAYSGATPVLCDVERECGLIDLIDAEDKITPDVRAIIPVHLYGQSCDMDAILNFANRHGLMVIEDSCQAFGARWQGKKVGTIGQIGCYSFYPGKNLGAAGEAGLIVTNDDNLARRMRLLRVHAQLERYLHEEIGYNYRMDGLQGLVLGHKLPRLDEWTNERRRIAKLYQDGLKHLPIDIPYTGERDHVWHLYVIRSTRRDELRDYLQSIGIETGLHYPVPLHRQPALAHYRQTYHFPVTDIWASQCLSLPIYVGMTDREIELVISGINSFFRKS